MKLPPSAAYPLQTTLMSACMAIVMSTALTLMRAGFVSGWLTASLENAIRAFPIALAVTFLISPLVRRLVARLTQPQRVMRTRKVIR